MSIQSNSSSLQAYGAAVYRAALHPEFFEIEGRRRIAHGEYDFEAWVTRGGHALRFERDDLCITEVVAEEIGHLPERGLATTLQCAGERDHEQEFSERVTYMVSIQTETLPDHLYLGTVNELLEHARVTEGIITEWRDELGKPNLSLIDLQRYNDEIHAQSYHLRSDCGLVLRTQTIFGLKKS